MLNKIIVVFLLIWAVSTAQAQEIELAPDHPDSYVVVKGDTLWDISGRFLQEPWRWPEIWEVNPQIEDPHLIYPGDVVSLQFNDAGEPVLSVDRDTGDADTTMDNAVSSQPMPTDRNVKLSPTVREYSREDAIHSIPVDVIRHFLTRALIWSDEEYFDSPYVIAVEGDELVSSRGDKIFVRGIARGSEGETYGIYRKGEKFVSNGELLGYGATHIADVVVMEGGDPSTLMVTESKREIDVGDRLIKQSEKEVNSDFIPTMPPRGINGSIIDSIDTVYAIGRHQVVAIDQGTRDGIEVGNVLGVFQQGRLVKDDVTSQEKPVINLNNNRLIKYLGQFKSWDKVRIPEDLGGVIMVFRTFDKMSYGLVMEAYKPLQIHDTVKNL